jgi:hypothetical protein
MLKRVQGLCLMSDRQHLAMNPPTLHLCSETLHLHAQIPDAAAGPGEEGVPSPPLAEDPEPSRAVAPPNSTSRAFDKSPSGPAIAVKVCPQRGPGGTPAMGKLRGLGTGRGLPSSMFNNTLN